jgi:hypothetical protein
LTWESLFSFLVLAIDADFFCDVYYFT